MEGLFPEHKTIGQHAKAVTALEFSPSGALLSSASADQTCVLYRTCNYEKASQLGPEHSEGLNDVTWMKNCDDSTIATASDDKHIKVWDVETGKVLSTLKGHQNFVFSLAAHPFQSYLVSGSEDETIRLWDLRCANHCLHVMEAHDKPITSVSIHPTGDNVLSSSVDGLLRIWDFRTMSCRRTIMGDEQRTAISHAQYTPNGLFVLASLLNDTMRLIRPLHTFIQTCHSTSRGSYSTVDVHKRFKRSCPVRSIEVVKHFTGHKASKFCCPSVFINTTSNASGPCAEGNDSFVATGSEDSSVCVWNLQTQEIHRLHGHSGPVLAMSYNFLSHQLATGAGGSDFEVRIWGENLSSSAVSS